MKSAKHVQCYLILAPSIPWRYADAPELITHGSEEFTYNVKFGNFFFCFKLRAFPMQVRFVPFRTPENSGTSELGKRFHFGRYSTAVRSELQPLSLLVFILNGDVLSLMNCYETQSR